MGFHTFNLIADFQDITVLDKLTSSAAIKVIVVLQEQEKTELIDGLLKKILSAIHIDLAEDVQLVKASTTTSINILKPLKDLEIDKVLCFGIEPHNLAFNFSPTLYKPIHIENRTFLFVDSLSKIEADQNRKKMLWSNLQTIFSP